MPQQKQMSMERNGSKEVIFEDEGQPMMMMMITDKVISITIAVMS